MAAVEKDKSKQKVLSLINFEINSYKFNNPRGELKQVGFEIRIETKKEDDLFKIIIVIEAKKNKDAKRIISKIETVTTFKSEVSKNKSVTKLPPIDFMTKLVETAYSTTRGALIAKSQDNIISKFPLPLFDIKKVINRQEISNQEDGKNKKE